MAAEFLINSDQGTPNSWWSNANLAEDAPLIVGAMVLADKGFGITIQRATIPSGEPLPREITLRHVAIHTQTDEDRKALGALMGTDEMKTLRMYAAAMLRNHYLPEGMLLPQTPRGPLSKEEIGPQLSQAADRLGLKPRKPGLLSRVRKNLFR